MSGAARAEAKDVGASVQEDLGARTIELLRERGVELPDIAELTYNILTSQSRGGPKRSRALERACLESVVAVLGKREVQHAVLTGIALDVLAERGGLEEPLASIIARDDSLYGVDETLALSITNIYGAMGLTGFGYLDKTKPGVISRLNSRSESGRRRIHTFLDDLVAAIAAAGAARLIHGSGRDGEVIGRGRGAGRAG